MARNVETDEITGVETTGHEWDGIKELDNPMPRWWLMVFYASILFSVLWWILYPSWPTGSGYLKGVLGSNQRVELEERMVKARAGQAVWLERIAAADTVTMLADPELRQFAIAGGGVAFKDNCAPCHALGGAGQLQYPVLADDEWLWGGTLEDIELTIRHGIRSGTEEGRDSMMPAFGADGLLETAQIRDVAQHVLALGGREADPAAAERGAVVFEENCAACHGERGEGMAMMGAPALDDAIWLYGGSAAEIAAQISRPRHGMMPAWQGRLEDETIKMLTVYVHSLGGGQ
ncbi:cytochrome-c oxidase, cbb3-type subunit III [Geminicoccaceae bacterium 1502E]|nr:cytochrome-c oxidase, cbb3-type subunit III [Geminicoccaceae bacterium 1502E]